MSPLILEPFAIGVSFAIVAAIARAGEHFSVDGAQIYRYSPGLAYFAIVMGALIGATPFLLPIVQSQTNSQPLGWPPVLIAATIALTQFVAGPWMLRFRVILKADSITYGAFFRKRILFKDIVKIKVSDFDLRGKISVYPRSGWTAVFTYTLNDYVSLKNEILRRAPTGIPIVHFGRKL